MNTSTEIKRTAATLIRTWGLDPAAFEIDHHESLELAELLGLDNGVLTIRCRDSGDERMYATGEGSAYFGELFADLATGRFETPVAVH